MIPIQFIQNLGEGLVKEGGRMRKKIKDSTEKDRSYWLDLNNSWVRTGNVN